MARGSAAPSPTARRLDLCRLGTYLGWSSCLRWSFLASPAARTIHLFISGSNAAMSQAPSHDNSSPRAKRLNAWAVILLFGFLVLLPFLVQFAGLGETSGENRNLAEFPTLRSAKEIKVLPRKLDAYVNDRFGLRSQLVHLNSLIRYKLGVSSTRDVVIGEDDWLFYTADFLMEQHTGANVFSPEELERWVASMQDIQDCLAKRGLPFYILIAPDKSTMYPEKIPDYPRPPEATTRFD